MFNDNSVVSRLVISIRKLIVIYFLNVGQLNSNLKKPRTLYPENLRLSS